MPREKYDSLEALEALCTDKACESRTLEFKEKQPGKGDRDKNELGKDVAAFANANGGHIIFGISDIDGTADALCPISNETADALVRRLGQTLDALLEPRVQGLAMSVIMNADESYFLVVEVPTSLKGPHRLFQGGKSRFVIREDRYIRDMSYAEIRGAFAGLNQMIEEIREFRHERVGEVERGWSDVSIDSPSQCLIHVAPIATALGKAEFNLHSANEDWLKFISPNWGGGSNAFNFDGLLVYRSGPKAGEIFEYRQIYRSGMIEACHRAVHNSEQHRNLVPALTLCENVRNALNVAVREYRSQGISGPLALMVSLIGVEDKVLGLGRREIFDAQTLDRGTLKIPDALIENFEDEDQIEAAFRFVFDVIWQSFGYSQCTFYDAEGKWTNPR